MVKLYDTLQGKVVDFVPRKKGEVSIYVCGPTVYDVPHLGHARTAITYDVIARYFEWLGNKVALVVNITDIDDKIIACAQKESASEKEIAEKYLTTYREQMQKLGVRPPVSQPKATEYIKQMQDLILQMLEKGMAYAIEGLGIYFDTEAYSKAGFEYGELIHRSIKDLEESGQGRIEADDRKRNQLDFALWKTAKLDEPSWEWQPSIDMPAGRPGWHIECVAMSLGELGDGFDIHGGGSDLIFPHHENERAEAISLGNKFARYWMHSGMVNLSGKKMAKSDNNYITLAAQLNESNSNSFRLAMLQTHYRSEMELSPEILKSASTAISRIEEFARRIAQRDNRPLTGAREKDRLAFQKCMDNDFAAPSAVALIFEILSEGTKAAYENENFEAARQCLGSIKELSEALGLALKIPAVVESLKNDPEIQKLIDKREKARAEKDYAKADELRNKLSKKGITAIDNPDNTTDYLSK